MKKALHHQANQRNALQCHMLLQITFTLTMWQRSSLLLLKRYHPLVNFTHNHCCDHWLSFDIKEVGSEGLVSLDTCVGIPLGKKKKEVWWISYSCIKQIRAQYAEDASGNQQEYAHVDQYNVNGQAPLCVYFLRGSCSRGNDCLFSHSLQAKRPQCKFFFSLQVYIKMDDFYLMVAFVLLLFWSLYFIAGV